LLFALTFANDSYDFIFCSHVLEHIPDDKKAISEIYRVLKPGGTAMLMVPIYPLEKTADLYPKSPDLMTHVHQPGLDYFKRYEKAGFSVNVYYPEKIFDKEKYGLRAGWDPVAICYKSPNTIEKNENRILVENPINKASEITTTKQVENSSKPSSTCFVFVCQQGELEIKSMLLAASLKRYLQGEFECVAAIPQPDTRWGIISKETRALMQTLGVRLLPITNPINDNYPIGHKVACLGIDTFADKIVFLDSDILCFSEFRFDSQSPFSAKPADLPTFTKNVAVWQQVYDLCQLPLPDERIISSVSGESMLPYFNSGVIAVQKGLGFAKMWAECCRTIDAETSITNKRPWLDQIALPIAVAKLNLAYECLDERFNYPAHLKPLPKSPNSSEPFLCHYHSPSVLRREPQLNQLVIELVETYPILKTRLLASPEWAQLLKPSKLSRLSKHRQFQSEPEAIITGIPRSGTSYLCRLLHTLPNCVVINEPPQIIAPLANESRPWQIATFYQALRRDI
jgi:hypothetical protein